MHRLIGGLPRQVGCDSLLIILTSCIFRYESPVSLGSDDVDSRLAKAILLAEASCGDWETGRLGETFGVRGEWLGEIVVTAGSVRYSSWKLEDEIGN